MLLMGLPFLLFGLSSAIPLIVVVLVLFVIGEMLWVPTSQSIVAGLAPEDLRGAYMGAFGGTAAMGSRWRRSSASRSGARRATRRCGRRSPSSRSWAPCSARSPCRGVGRRPHGRAGLCCT